MLLSCFCCRVSTKSARSLPRSFPRSSINLRWLSQQSNNNNNNKTTAEAASSRSKTEVVSLREQVASLQKKLQQYEKAASSSSTGSDAAVDRTSSSIPPPTGTQLRNVFVGSAIPMMAFGFMDQSVMLQSGNAIDCTIGVWFGLPTLFAAGIGQVISAAAAIIFGGTVENVLRSGFGIPPPTGLTSVQRRLKTVEQCKFAGNFVGVVLGCCLGLVNLMLIDTEKSSTLKLQALTEEQEFAYEIEVDNVMRDNATVFKFNGPDVDGVLASMVSVLTARECSLVELDADSMDGQIEDVFVVQRDGKALPDEELSEIAREMLDATKSPTNVHLMKEKIREAEERNDTLQARLHRLEKTLEEKQITIVTK